MPENSYDDFGPVRFGILGPLSISIGNRPVRIGKNRQLVVLAALLTQANKTVSVERIIDAVWGETPPATADKQIQTCVWRLRSAFDEAGAPPDIIETGQGGYLLRLDGDALDAQVFEDHARRGHARAEAGDLAGAVEEYRAALALFQGPPLADLTGPAVEAVAAYWEERRLSVLEKRLEIELALGRQAELIGDLTLLVAEFPLREQLRAQLMTALYLADRRADALSVYSAGRAALVNNLGLDPGARLQDLQRRIIAGEPFGNGGAARTRPVAQTPAQLPADICDFTGRAAELEWMERQLRADRSDAPPCVGLVGRGGVGKTTLAVHAAHRLRSRFPDGQLFVALGGHADPQAPREVLGRFLAAFGVPEHRVPDELSARSALFRSVIAGRRVLIVLDDAVDCAQTEPLMSGDSGSAVVFTSHSRMVETRGAAVRRLDGLGPAESVSLLAEVIGAERVDRERESSRALVELCGHLPLAIRAGGARLDARPNCRIARFVERLADEDRRIAELTYGSFDPAGRLMAGVPRLAPATRCLWLLLSLPDLPRIPVWAAAVLADLSEDETQRLLDDLVDHQLLDIVGADVLGASYYGFHPLIRIWARERAADDLPARGRTEAVDRLLDTLCRMEDHARRVLDGRGRAAGIGRVDPSILQDVTDCAGSWLDQERSNFARLRQSVAAGRGRVATRSFERRAKFGARGA